MYILVCTDLPLATQLVQVAHAAEECGLYLSAKTPEPNNIIICQTPDEASLRAELALHDPALTRLITECDLGSRATAFAHAPVSGAARKPFRGWKLWTPSSSHAEVA